jgi:hypothetical protein
MDTTSEHRSESLADLVSRILAERADLGVRQHGGAADLERAGFVPRSAVVRDSPNHPSGPSRVRACGARGPAISRCGPRGRP